MLALRYVSIWPRDTVVAFPQLIRSSLSSSTSTLHLSHILCRWKLWTKLVNGTFLSNKCYILFMEAATKETPGLSWSWSCLFTVVVLSNKCNLTYNKCQHWICCYGGRTSQFHQIPKTNIFCHMLLNNPQNVFSIRGLQGSKMLVWKNDHWKTFLNLTCINEFHKREIRSEGQ